MRHELAWREVTVARVEPLGQEFVRVVFGGPELQSFVSLGFDDHVKFMVDDSRSGDAIRRDYTPRRFDFARCELTLDFALHGGGGACAWAQQASVGQRAVIGGPKGSMIVPDDYDWHLLAGDATAAPAMGRRLAELPAGSHAIVVAQLAELAVLELHQTKARVELRQVATADDTVAAIAALPWPAGDGFAWCAGEAGAMARVRDIVLAHKSHPKDALRVAAYWKRGAADFHADLTVSASLTGSGSRGS